MPRLTKNRKRFIEAEDLCRFQVINSVALSPNEKQIAYTVEVISNDQRKYFSHLYMAYVKSGETRQYTFGEINDRAPVWSPDGKYIAFLSTRDKKSGVYIIPATGGGERKIYEAEGAFGELSWTPDGKSLVYQFRYNDSHYIKDEKKKKEAPVYRHITRLWYRLDGSGFLPQDRFHIWRLDIDSGKATQLTKGKYDEQTPSVSPDGKWVAFTSNRSKNPDLESLKEDLYLIPITGGRMKKIPAPEGPKSSPVFSPDGKKLAYIGHTNTSDAWGVTNYHLWTVGINGRPQAKDLTAGFDRHVIDLTIGDMGEGAHSGTFSWSPDSRRIYFLASDTGNTHVFYIPARGGKPTRITHANCHVKGFSLNGPKKHIAALVSTLSSPGNINYFPAVYKGDQKSEKIDDPNRKLFASINSPRIREIWFKANDGTDLQGWLVTPPNFNKNKKYPGILEIHGGPRVQYGFTFYFEMLYLASKGYVVFYHNPRGGNGRGQTFAETIVADWGSHDYQDCMAAADYLAGLPYVNDKKMGVTGGSYGGYMTNWIVGHTDRFKAAVTQRSVWDLSTFVGTSDIGHELYREFKGQPWEVPEVYEKCSPITYVKNIKTPLLIIHSENDLRCGIEQGERLFMMLKLMKKKVEMVRFPEEPHGLSRHGRPDRRLARLNWISKWFKRYLK